MTIENAIIDLQETLLGLAGMKAAPDQPPEGIGAFPFAVSYERTGEFLMHSYGFGDELVTIYCEIHVNRTILSKAVEQAMTFRDPFLEALLSDPTLGGHVSTIRGVRWTFGRLEWAGVETIGYRFEVDVKVQETI